MDHLRPCASFDMTKESDRYECFNWSNVVPCEARENESKSATIDKKLIKYYDKCCNEFIDEYTS